MTPPPSKRAYEGAGVSLAANERVLELIADAVRATYTPNVLAGLGAFGGVLDLSFLKACDRPVLVASTDGVGTKALLAARLGCLTGLGYDLVNHGLNDILVMGARPVFFMDYLAGSHLPPELSAKVITSVAQACREAGVILLGGETAELPGVYQEGALDLVGTVVGVCERAELVTGADIRAGDVVFALPSSGLHTNGYSLARRVLAGRYDEPLGESTVGEVLLRPHRHYLEPVQSLRKALRVKGMAHVTGGGIPGNLPRILPEGLGAIVEQGSWPTPDIFRLIQSAGKVSEAEMLEVFNMGAGLLLVVAPEDADGLMALCPEPIYRVGEIIEGEGVRLV